MNELISTIGVATIISTIVAFIFDAIKNRVNRRFEELLMIKINRYNSMLSYMITALNPDNKRHVDCPEIELLEGETLEQFIFEKLQIYKSFSYLYSNRKVIIKLNNFILDPNTENYEKVAIEMRKDLWKKRVR